MIPLEARHLLAATLLLACSAQATSAEDRSSSACESVASFFREDTYKNVIASQCLGCHNESGFAAGTRLVFQRDAISDDLAAIARLSNEEADGQSLILVKAVGGRAHGGGSPIHEGSSEYRSLETLVTALRSSSSCVR